MPKIVRCSASVSFSRFRARYSLARVAEIVLPTLHFVEFFLLDDVVETNKIQAAPLDEFDVLGLYFFLNSSAVSADLSGLTLSL